MLLAAGEVVVFDLEYTAWDGSLQRNWSGPGEYREIIQIGAVRLDLADLQRTPDHLSVHVCPKINPLLSGYITRLTGITDALLRRSGLELDQAIETFLAFAGDDIPLLANGGDGEALQQNLALRNMPCPFRTDRFLDISRILASAIGSGETAIRSAELADVMGLAIPGKAHDALHDARCIAGALMTLRHQDRL